MSQIKMALVLMFLCKGSVFAAKPKDQCSTLFITSTGPDQPGIAAVIEQARSEIQGAIASPTHFDIDYLDPQLSGPGPNAEVKVAGYLRVKYNRQKFDLIITIGPQALRFAEDHGSQLFPDARILSMILSPGRSGSETVSSAVVATVYAEPDFAPTMEVALEQNPGTQQVVLVAGSSANDKRQLQQARANLANYASRLQFLELTNYTFDQLKRKLSGLEPHSVILLVGFTADSTGEGYVSTSALRELSQSANRPIYAAFREQIGSGAVGGSVLDMREAGRIMGKTAVRVLNGEKPEKILVLGVKQQHYVFDARQLKRWHIGQPPSGSTVLNQEYLPGILYERKFIMLVLAVCLEALLIVLLFKATLRRKRAERDMGRLLAVVRLESCLATSIVSMPIGLVQTEIKRGFNQFIERIGIDCISIYEFQQKTQQFSLLCYSSVRGTTLRLSRLKPSDFKQTADKLRRGHSVVVRAGADLSQETLSDLQELKRSGLHSVAGFPIAVDKQVIGALFLSTSKDPDWDAALLDELQAIANIVASGLDRAMTRASLGRSEQLKSAILTSLPASVVVLDRNGCVVDFNCSDTMMSFECGFGLESLAVGTDYRELCRKAANQGSRQAQAALNGLQCVLLGVSIHFEIEYPWGVAPHQRWSRMSVVPLSTEQNGVVVVHTDVTERKLAESELKESEGRFRLMADSAPVMMWMAGTDKLCTHFNKSWLDFTGNSLADEIGEGWVRGVHPEDLKKCLEVYTTAFDARKQFTMEYRLRRFDGQYRWVMDRGVPRFRNDGSFAGYIGCADDITEQRENEALRAELSGRLLRAQEEERARVARELHDDINQKLGLLAVDIQTLQQSAPQTVAEIHAALDDLFKTTNSISADIQHLSHKLHSSRLDYLGLAAALRRLSVEFAEQHGLAIECVITDMPDKLSREIGLCLFRVAQECLTNVAKHSSATRVAVRLQCLEGTIRMSVSDDGNGFNYANVGVRKDPGLGLISMQERLRLVNGDLTIHSEEDMGTQITAVVPLTLEERSAPNTSSKMARKFA